MNPGPFRKLDEDALLTFLEFVDLAREAMEVDLTLDPFDMTVSADLDHNPHALGPNSQARDHNSHAIDHNSHAMDHDPHAMDHKSHAINHNSHAMGHRHGQFTCR
jgi:hypothetical protein